MPSRAHVSGEQEPERGFSAGSVSVMGKSIFKKEARNQLLTQKS